MIINKSGDLPAMSYGYYDGMIPKGCVTIIAGQGASGKSTLMCYLAETLSRVAKTLIVSNEEDARIISARIRPVEYNVDIASFSQQPDNRKITRDELLQSLEEYDLVFVDSLVTFNDGKDINKSGTAEEFLTPFVRAVANSDKAIVFLHHTNKGGGDSLQDIVSGSERLVSGVRHCKVVINDQMHGRRFLCVVKDNTNMKTTNLEIISEKIRLPDGGDMTVIQELVPTTVDMEKIIYENSKASKIKKWDREIFAEEKARPIVEEPPESVKRVLLHFGSNDLAMQDVKIELGENEYSYFGAAMKRTGDKWAERMKNGREITYRWTEKALSWLESQ